MLQLQKYDFSIVNGDTTNLKLNTSYVANNTRVFYNGFLYKDIFFSPRQLTVHQN